ncbi:MAG: alpha-L-fucosidase [Verrucomicrobiales bacterium]|jgi:alpha-L-fucosidase|nr:alpha-L-fucosidase [Verrucomicrobiales bacterium]
MKTHPLLTLLIALLLTVSGSVFAQTEMPAEARPIPPDDPRWDWWREARFGLFIHWGPVSLKGTEIGWSRAGERRDKHETVGGIPAEEYDNLYRKFNPVKFSAQEWVDVAKAAGMKYIVLVAKHHDGFCLFDTKTSDYNIMRGPFKLDICAELAKACRENGMRLGFYFSPPDWRDTDFFTADHDRYLKRMHEQVRELLTNYGQLDILWFDHNQGFGENNNPKTWDAAAMFPVIRRLQPDILVTKRAGGWGDFNTPEQRVGGFDNQTPWESCITICKQWSWKADDEMKSLAECLRTLILCAGGDGNLLFNVGPMPSGEIEPRQVQRLKEMGAWLAQYGGSIYGTRGGPYKPGAWGASTFKGSVVYLHIFKWHDGKIVLPPLTGKKILRATALTGGAVTVSDDGKALTVSASAPADIDTLVKLELDATASDLTPLKVILPVTGLTASASNVYQNDPDCGPNQAFDDDPKTRWATDEGVKQATLTVNFDTPQTFSRVEIREEYQRVQSFELQYKAADGQWQTFYKGAGIGGNFKTSLSAPVTAREIRLQILDATDGPSISEFKLTK